MPILLNASSARLQLSSLLCVSDKIIAVSEGFNLQDLKILSKLSIQCASIRSLNIFIPSELFVLGTISIYL